MKLLIVVLTLLLVAGCAQQERGLQLVSGSQPVYPADARAQRIEGAVVIRYDVARDGRVVNARVKEARPEGVFDAAALEAVRSWRYNPPIRDGQPVTVENVVSTVYFELDGAEAYDDY